MKTAHAVATTVGDMFKAKKLPTPRLKMPEMPKVIRVKVRRLKKNERLV